MARNAQRRAQGYVSLFPLLLSLEPAASSRVANMLDMMRDPRRLWSPFGLRSLSRAHPLFGKDEDYWRGAIWLPMNYMAIRALSQVRPPIVLACGSRVIAQRSTAGHRAHIARALRLSAPSSVRPSSATCSRCAATGCAP